jgi:hypothetical protein
MPLNIKLFVLNDDEEDLKLVMNIVMQITQIMLLLLRLGM